MRTTLSLLGGTPAGPPIPISQPTLPDYESYAEHLKEIFASRQLTNGRWVKRLEEEAAERIGVEEVVAVSSATSGLMLVAKLLEIRGEVLLPAFTFPATLHILLWNGLTPRLVDVDLETFNLDPRAAQEKAAQGAGAIVPVYIFGNAPEWSAIESLQAANRLRCFSDAAHALGTSLGGRAAGTFGDAEVFSLAPTKVTVAGEGGLIATRNRELASDLRIARNYGNPGDYDCLWAGLNARQSEMHALLATLSLRMTDASIDRRASMVRRYREGLRDLRGLAFQKIDPECRSTHNYFAVRIVEREFGLTNREVKSALEAEAIQSRIYFYPPLHRQSRFHGIGGLEGSFPNTDLLCGQVLCLPLFSHIEEKQVDRVMEAVRACAANPEAVRRALHAAGGSR